MQQAGQHAIMRKWSALIRTADETEYAAYINGTGISDFSSTPGNLGFQLLLRKVGDGRSEVMTISWWTSLDAVKGFAGDDHVTARYYPEDDRFLLTRPGEVEHFRVVPKG